MTSDAPIGSNLCDHCKPKGGKSIDFFNFLQGQGGKYNIVVDVIHVKMGLQMDV